MKKALIAFIFAVSTCAAQTSPSLINNSYLNGDNVQLQISLYQQNYTLSQPLTVKVVLKNTGTEDRTITVYPEASLCFDFNIIDGDRNLAGKKADYRNPALSGWKNGLKSAREIRLFPGEEFSETIDVNNWYNITNIGHYSLQASFLDVKRGRRIFSNPVFVNLRPNERVIAKLKIEDELKRQEEETVMTPEGTVKFMLDAMQNRDWESFFKYWDFEKVLVMWNRFDELYKSATDNEGRAAAVESFKKWYKAVPQVSTLKSYKIQNIVFPVDSKRRTVYFYVQYSERFFPNRYLYSYSLEQRGNKWYLAGVDAFITKKNSKKEDSQDFDYTQVKLKKD